MSWQEVKLSDITESIQTGPFGSQLHQSDYSIAGTPVVMPKDLQNGKISEASIARVEQSHVDRLSKHKILAGDILYSRRGDVGRCAFATEVEKGWLCGTGCLRVTIDKSKAEPQFVFYQLQKAETIGWVINHAVGSTMLNLNTSILSDVPLQIPEIEEQRRIIGILSAYDNLIENNQKQIKLLEEAAQRLYKEWFVDLHFPGYENAKIVDGVPEGWKNGILGDVATDTGIKEKKEKRNAYKYYLPIDCMPKKSLSYTQMSDISLAESSLVGFQKGDILFGAMRPYFHKVVVARDKGLTRSTCFVLNAKEQTYWSFVAMLLFAKDTVDYATQISVGTTMPYVRWKDMKDMPTIIPDSDTTKKFNKQIQPIVDNIARLSEKTILLQQARDRLLPKLMSGELEV